VSRNSKLLLSLALALLASTAAADGDYFSPTGERIAISLGIIKVAPSTSVRVDSSAGVAGTTLNGEDDLGLDSSVIEPKFEASVRAGQRSRLFFDYFTLDRDDTKVLALPPGAAFGDVVLLNGDPVQTVLSLRILGVTYGYSFLHNEKFELSGLIGINDTEISSSVRVQSPTRHIFDAQSLAGPFPTPGLAATWAVSKHFYVDATAKYLKVSIDHLEGSLSIYDFEAFYRVSPNVAFAVGYSGTRANLLSRQSKDSGAFIFDAKGPELFVRVAF